jgi:RNA-binding protein
VNARSRAELSKRAHSLKPAAYVGKEGLTDEVVASIVQALSTRDLLKIRVQENAPAEARDIGFQLAERIDGAEVVRTMGRVVTLYRPIPEKAG